MLLFISSVSQSFASIRSFSESTDGNIVERTSGGVTTEFGYDLVGQLISEARNGYAASYTYDANGNRLTRTVNNVTEENEYDGADKLLEVSINQQTVKEFTYDAAGRTTSVTTSAGTTTLTWDYEDRLVGITYPNTSTNSFTYNAFGARVSKTDSSGTATYARNGVSVIAPVLSDGSLTYTPGISTNDGSDSTWSHGDIKNSLRQTGENESTTATTTYDAFGNPTSSTGTWQGPFQYGGPFGYQTDSDSGLKLLGHRYYDSSTGRFLSKDRAKHGGNWFTYCANNPLGRMDNDGKLWREILIGPWAMIPTMIGGIASIGGRQIEYDVRTDTTIVEGGWVADIIARNGYAAIALGTIVITPAADELDPGLYAHEVVHTSQAVLLGPLYLPVYGIGAIRGAAQGHVHDANPFEIMADEIAGEHNKYKDTMPGRKLPLWALLHPVLGVFC